MAAQTHLIPIYTTRGDLGAFLGYPYIFSPSGEWIGWVMADRRVYSVHGHYVGEIGDGPRILRRRSLDFSHPHRQPPERPSPVRPPQRVPLPLQMSELTFSMMDVLEEQPELLPSIDSGEYREDMD